MVRWWSSWRDTDLIADTQYEIPVAVQVTPASASEQIALRDMVAQTFAQDPELAERCRDFSADRGLDSAQTKALLRDEYAIRPLIDTRELWREEKQQPDYDPPQGMPALRPNRPVPVSALSTVRTLWTKVSCAATPRPLPAY